MSLSIKDRFFHSSVWSFAGGWLSQFVTFLTFVLLARLLEPEDFGLMAVVGIVLAAVQVLANPGFSQAIVNVPEIDDELTSTAFWVSLLVSLSAAALVFFGAWLFYPLYGNPELQALLFAAAPLILLAVPVLLPHALLTRSFGFKQLTTISFYSNVIGGCVALVAALSGFGVWALLIQLYAMALVRAWIFVRQQTWQLRGRPTGAGCKRLFKYGGHFFGINSVSFLNLRMDNALVGFLFGLSALGIYVVSKRILIILTDLLVRPLSQVSLAAFSRVERQTHAICHAYTRVVVNASLVSVPAFSGFIIVAPEFMQLAFGDKWDEAILLSQLMCLVGLVRGVTFFTVPVLTALEKGRQAFFFQAANTAGNFIAYMALFPLGLMGIGLGFSARGLLFFAITLYILRAMMGLEIRQLLKELAPIYVATGIMIVALMGLKTLIAGSHPAFILFACVIPGVIIFVFFVSLLKRSLITEPLMLLKKSLRGG